MDKDDYFVVAYLILSYLYACFKADELVLTAFIRKTAHTADMYPIFWTLVNH